ncbi:MAG TPA: hypothetical protein ENO14_00705 [Chromatiales bacterium]|nr:hypothetical protein [Chromatiales bacterium]
MAEAVRELLPKLTAEFGIIVVGVFVALWANSWAERRSEKDARWELLHALASEVEANALVLDSAAARADKIVDAMTLLLAVHDGNEAVPSADSVETLLSLATSYWRAHQQGLAFGAYDGMVASGTGRLLPSREIGRRLARHRQSLEKGQGDESLAEDALEHVYTVLRRHGSGLAFMPELTLSSRKVIDRARPRDLPALIADPAFADALWIRIVYEGNIVAFYRRQASELHSTFALIREQLDVESVDAP